MKIKEFAFICYPVTDMKRARAFYEGVLGFQFEPKGHGMEEQWVEYHVGPHYFTLGCHEGFKPSPEGPLLALEMENFEEAVAELKQHGVKFKIEPMETPVCHMAALYDPEGNQIMIHKLKA